MIDFIKCEIINTNLEQLEASTYLDFHNKVNTRTGELGKYLNAYYKGMEFKIYEPSETHPQRRATIEGSLHKYWNNGAHNFNDFGIVAVAEVRKNLKEIFNIDFKNCILKQLEIGVNILPPVPTKKLLRYCLLHKTKELKSIYTKDEGNYIQTKNQRHFIKLYDKRTHYTNKGFEIDTEIFRIEKKYTKMMELNTEGIFNLKDLMNYDLSRFKSELLKLWQSVLFYDWTILNSTKYKNTYSNSNYWLDLSENNYENFKYHKKNLHSLVSKNPKNIKKQIAELISKKVDFLNCNTTEINPLHIRLKTVVSTLEKTDQYRRLCLVTGLNISMQKKDSFLLSHTGLKYYYKTDLKIYKEVKYRYLSTNWINSDYQTEIKEIAHNIRNYYNNQRIKQTKLYPPEQKQLFDITF